MSVGSLTASFDWAVPPSVLGERATEYRENLLAAIHELLDVFGGQVVASAKSGAPWTDRTAHARQGLQHRIRDEGAVLALVLYHSAEYGIWLEVRWGGRWSIIMKTLQLFYPRLMAALAALVR